MSDDNTRNKTDAQCRSEFGDKDVTATRFAPLESERRLERDERFLDDLVFIMVKHDFDTGMLDGLLNAVGKEDVDRAVDGEREKRRQECRRW